LSRDRSGGLRAAPNFIDKDLDKAHALADNNYTSAGERETNSATACREGALDVASDIGRSNLLSLSALMQNGKFLAVFGPTAKLRKSKRDGARSLVQ
jgi:hypothetical protein